MNDALHLRRIARLLADPARAAIAWTLIDGTTRPAGELAFAAGISPQSASAHLSKLVEGGLLSTRALGRHRYFRIASAEAAGLIESVASFGASVPARAPRPPPLARAMPRQFLYARTCYDHLAGDVAVQILQAMLDQGWLVAAGHDYEATRAGRRQLTELGLDLDAATQRRRAFARGCVDLTERRPHLGGTLGAALLHLYEHRRWILRTARSRVVSITARGHAAFRRHLGVVA